MVSLVRNSATTPRPAAPQGAAATQTPANPVHRPASPPAAWRRLTGRGHHDGARRRLWCRVQPRRRQRRRSRRRTTGRRRWQRLAIGVAAGGAGQRQAGQTASLIAGIAGDRVGQRQTRFAALPGARVGHRQCRCPRLADLRVGALRRQQHVGVQAEVGERGVDERLHELARQQVGDVGLEERPGCHRFAKRHRVFGRAA